MPTPDEQPDIEPGVMPKHKAAPKVTMRTILGTVRAIAVRAPTLITREVMSSKWFDKHLRLGSKSSSTAQAYIKAQQDIWDAVIDGQELNDADLTRYINELESHQIRPAYYLGSLVEALSNTLSEYQGLSLIKLIKKFSWLLVKDKEKQIRQLAGLAVPIASQGLWFLASASAGFTNEALAAHLRDIQSLKREKDPAERQLIEARVQQYKAKLANFKQYYEENKDTLTEYLVNLLLVSMEKKVRRSLEEKNEATELPNTKLTADQVIGIWQKLGPDTEVQLKRIIKALIVINEEENLTEESKRRLDAILEPLGAQKYYYLELAMRHLNIIEKSHSNEDVDIDSYDLMAFITDPKVAQSDHESIYIDYMATGINGVFLGADLGEDSIISNACLRVMLSRPIRSATTNAHIYALQKAQDAQERLYQLGTNGSVVKDGVYGMKSFLLFFKDILQLENGKLQSPLNTKFLEAVCNFAGIKRPSDLYRAVDDPSAHVMPFDVPDDVPPGINPDNEDLSEGEPGQGEQKALTVEDVIKLLHDQFLEGVAFLQESDAYITETLRWFIPAQGLDATHIDKIHEAQALHPNEAVRALQCALNMAGNLERMIDLEVAEIDKHMQEKDMRVLLDMALRKIIIPIIVKRVRTDKTLTDSHRTDSATYRTEGRKAQWQQEEDSHQGWMAALHPVTAKEQQSLAQNTFQEYYREKAASLAEEDDQDEVLFDHEYDHFVVIEEKKIAHNPLRKRNYRDDMGQRLSEEEKEKGCFRLKSASKFALFGKKCTPLYHVKVNLTDNTYQVRRADLNSGWTTVSEEALAGITGKNRMMHKCHHEKICASGRYTTTEEALNIFDTESKSRFRRFKQYLAKPRKKRTGSEGNVEPVEHQVLREASIDRVPEPYPIQESKYRPGDSFLIRIQKKINTRVNKKANRALRNAEYYSLLHHKACDKEFTLEHHMRAHYKFFYQFGIVRYYLNRLIRLMTFSSYRKKQFWQDRTQKAAGKLKEVLAEAVTVHDMHPSYVGLIKHAMSHLTNFMSGIYDASVATEALSPEQIHQEFIRMSPKYMNKPTLQHRAGYRSVEEDNPLIERAAVINATNTQEATTVAELQSQTIEQMNGDTSLKCTQFSMPSTMMPPMIHKTTGLDIGQLENNMLLKFLIHFHQESSRLQLESGQLDYAGLHVHQVTLEMLDYPTCRPMNTKREVTVWIVNDEPELTEDALNQSVLADYVKMGWTQHDNLHRLTPADVTCKSMGEALYRIAGQVVDVYQVEGEITDQQECDRLAQQADEAMQEQGFEAVLGTDYEGFGSINPLLVSLFQKQYFHAVGKMPKESHVKSFYLGLEAYRANPGQIPKEWYQLMGIYKSNSGISGEAIVTQMIDEAGNARFALSVDDGIYNNWVENQLCISTDVYRELASTPKQSTVSDLKSSYDLITTSSEDADAAFENDKMYSATPNVKYMPTLSRKGTPHINLRTFRTFTQISDPQPLSANFSNYTQLMMGYHIAHAQHEHCRHFVSAPDSPLDDSVASGVLSYADFLVPGETKYYYKPLEKDAELAMAGEFNILLTLENKFVHAFYGLPYLVTGSHTLDSGPNTYFGEMRDPQQYQHLAYDYGLFLRLKCAGIVEGCNHLNEEQLNHMSHFLGEFIQKWSISEHAPNARPPQYNAAHMLFKYLVIPTNVQLLDLVSHATFKRLLESLDDPDDILADLKVSMMTRALIQARPGELYDRPLEIIKPLVEFFAYLDKLPEEDKALVAHINIYEKEDSYIVGQKVYKDMMAAFQHIPEKYRKYQFKHLDEYPSMPATTYSRLYAFGYTTLSTSMGFDAPADIQRAITHILNSGIDIQDFSINNDLDIVQKLEFKSLQAEIETVLGRRVNDADFAQIVEAVYFRYVSVMCAHANGSSEAPHDYGYYKKYWQDQCAPMLTGSINRANLCEKIQNIFGEYAKPSHTRRLREVQRTYIKTDNTAYEHVFGNAMLIYAHQYEPAETQAFGECWADDAIEEPVLAQAASLCVVISDASKDYEEQKHAFKSLSALYNAYVPSTAYLDTLAAAGPNHLNEGQKQLKRDYIAAHSTFVAQHPEMQAEIEATATWSGIIDVEYDVRLPYQWDEGLVPDRILMRARDMQAAYKAADAQEAQPHDAAADLAYRAAKFEAYESLLALKRAYVPHGMAPTGNALKLARMTEQMRSELNAIFSTEADTTALDALEAGIVPVVQENYISASIARAKTCCDEVLKGAQHPRDGNVVAALGYEQKIAHLSEALKIRKSIATMRQKSETQPFEEKTLNDADAAISAYITTMEEHIQHSYPNQQAVIDAHQLEEQVSRVEHYYNQYLKGQAQRQLHYTGNVHEGLCGPEFIKLEAMLLKDTAKRKAAENPGVALDPEYIYAFIALTMLSEKGLVSGKQLRLEQLLSVLLLAQGDQLLGIDTSEGKTMILRHASLVRAALKGRISVLTHNDDLAKEGHMEVMDIAETVGLTASCVGPASNDDNRILPEATNPYQADIVYVSALVDLINDCRAKHFGTGPRMIHEHGRVVPREEVTVALDEADEHMNCLTTTTSQLAATAGLLNNRQYYRIFHNFLMAYDDMMAYQHDDLDTKVQFFREAFKRRINRHFDPAKPNFWGEEDVAAITRFMPPDDSPLWTVWHNAAKTANNLAPEVDYHVEQDRRLRTPVFDVNIMQRSSGEQDRSSQWSNGVHQMICAREADRQAKRLKDAPHIDGRRVAFAPENLVRWPPLTQVVCQGFIDKHMRREGTETIGVTGTEGQKISREKLLELMGAERAHRIPRHLGNRLYETAPVLFDTKEEKFQHLLYQIKRARGQHQTGSDTTDQHSLLIVFATLDEVQAFRDYCEINGVIDSVYVYDDLASGDGAGVGERVDVGELKDKATQKGAVTIGTTICGRGLDIRKMDKVLVGMLETEALRRQNTGRAGRGGQFGMAQPILCREDLDPTLMPSMTTPTPAVAITGTKAPLTYSKDMVRSGQDWMYDYTSQKEAIVVSQVDEARARGSRESGLQNAYHDFLSANPALSSIVVPGEKSFRQAKLDPIYQRYNYEYRAALQLLDKDSDGIQAASERLLEDYWGRCEIEIQDIIARKGQHPKPT